MKCREIPLTEELAFFYHLRLLMIVFVIVFHASISYATLVPWWFVLDIHNGFFNSIILFCDIFMMPVLFFVAGYFALPSLTRKGTSAFIAGKFTRLGLPFFLGIIFLVPIMPFLRMTWSSTESLTRANYGEFWLNHLKSAVNFNFGYITSFDQFNQYHLWFIMLLLIFFILFSLIYNVIDQTPLSALLQKLLHKNSNSPSLSILLIFGVVTSLGYYASISLFENGKWITLWNIVIFQPTKIFLYVAYFVLGIYGYSNGWFVRGNSFRHPLLWGLASIGLTIALLFTVKGAVIGQSSFIVLLFSFIRSFLCLGITICSISFVSQYLNTRPKTYRHMSLNSYSIYLIHLPIVVIMQYIFSYWQIFFPGAAYLKFGLVSLLSLLFSYIISVLLISPLLRKI